MSALSVRHQPLLTVREVAARLTCSEKTVWRLIDRGELREVRIAENELAAYIAKNQA